MTDRAVSPPTVDEVRQLLRSVIDPELGANIVDLGMATDVEVSPGGLITIGVKLTIKGCPLRAQIKNDIESRLETHPGVGKVKIVWGEMNAEERSEVMTKARWNARENAGDTAVPNSARVLAIASGKGGVGKSSVTANVAVALASHGHVVGVLDADIWYSRARCNLINFNF
ncbi:MAG: iron-sulfur cluster assembly protein [Ilumatobacteraceae bacterium]